MATMKLHELVNWAPDVPESEGLHERLFPIRKQTGRPVGDAALDT